jgi:hypothetical protein
MSFPSSDSFRSAGYQAITTNSSYQGGLVRQHGNFSFSRIFDAGHGVAGYQPETMFHLFERVMLHRDVATGQVDLLSNTDYASSGPASVRNVTNAVPEPELSTCYIYSVSTTCTEEQMLALAAGTAIVEDWILVSPGGTRGEVPGQGTSGGGQEGAGDTSDTGALPVTSGTIKPIAVSSGLLLVIAALLL